MTIKELKAGIICNHIKIEKNYSRIAINKLRLEDNMKRYSIGTDMQFKLPEKNRMNVRRRINRNF